jgi:hypothetical protein
MDEPNVEYELCEPFDIDNGELDGIAPHVVFTLGVEWEMLRQELDTGRLVSRMIHAENLNRFKAMCARRGREWVAGEAVDGWISVSVEAM